MLAKEADNVTVTHLNVDGKVNCKKLAGGLFAHANGTLDYLKVNVETSGIASNFGVWGGVIGEVTNSKIQIKDSDITYKFNNSATKAERQNQADSSAGGVIGVSKWEVKLDNVIVSSNLAAEYANKDDSSYFNMGGVIGAFDGTSGNQRMATTNVFAENELSLKTVYSTNIGGFAGSFHSSENLEVAFLDRIYIHVKKLVNQGSYEYGVSLGAFTGELANALVTNLTVYSDTTEKLPLSDATMTFLSYFYNVDAPDSIYTIPGELYRVANALFYQIKDTSKSASYMSFMDNVVDVDGLICEHSNECLRDFHLTKFSKYTTAEEVVEKMNHNLANPPVLDSALGHYFENGSYLPWYVDDEGKPGLKLFAESNELYVINNP